VRFKALISRKQPVVFGVIENQEVHYSHMPDLLKPTISLEELRKEVDPTVQDSLDEYELVDVELTIIRNTQTTINQLT
jgi:hypothetical protein